MFDNIKKKFSVIQQNLVFSSVNQLKISNSLSQLDHLGADGSNVENELQSSWRLVNPSAGCKLLGKNEMKWQGIHQYNEENANLARYLDKNIIRIRNNSENLHVNLQDLNLCILQLPEIEKHLKQLVSIVSEVKEKCDDLNEKLIKLQDVCEQIELNEKQFNHKLILSKFKRNKMSEIEEIRLHLASQNIENFKKIEENLKQIQVERQAVFQDAFENDLQTYKDKGSLPRIERVKEDHPIELSLEDVDLSNIDDDGRKELENFLNDTD